MQITARTVCCHTITSFLEYLRQFKARKNQNIEKVNTFHFLFVLRMSMFSLRLQQHRHESRFQTAAPCSHAIICRNVDWLISDGAHTLTGGPTKLLRATPASVPTLDVPTSPLKRRVRRDGTSRDHHINTLRLPSHDATFRPFSCFLCF